MKISLKDLRDFSEKIFADRFCENLGGLKKNLWNYLL
jgi:hypothetical protein